MKLTILAISARTLLSLGALALVLVVGLMTLGGNQAQAGHVGCGDELTTNTKLHSPLVCAGGVALTIGTDDITLKCNGNTVTGDDTGIGILLNAVSGVTVKNCHIANFAVGIDLDDSTGNELKNNEVTGSTCVGCGAFRLRGESDDNTLFNNTADGNAGRGFLLDFSSGNELKNNRATGNGNRGFDLTLSSDGNILWNNEAIDNGSAGFVVAASMGNILKNNRSTGSTSEGFAIFSVANTFTGNTANDNGTHGFLDSTGGGGTLGTGNVYVNNRCRDNLTGSSPSGLCTPQP